MAKITIKEIKRFKAQARWVFFEELFRLREAGTMNMFASPLHLVEVFEINIEEAKEIVKEWMDNFSELLELRKPIFVKEGENENKYPSSHEFIIDYYARELENMVEIWDDENVVFGLDTMIHLLINLDKNETIEFNKDFKITKLQ